MTRVERAEAEAKLKIKLLEPMASKDELKEAKKAKTKLANKYRDRAYKGADKFNALAWEAHRTFQNGYNDKSPKTPLQDAVWSCIGANDYYMRFVPNFPKTLELIEIEFPELHKMASQFWEDMKGDASYLVELENHLLDEEARLKGTTAEQFVLLASKNREVSQEKQLAFGKYATALKDWKPTEIKDGKIYVNGHLYEEGKMVGVMIGRGCRVHSMSLSIGEVEDKKTKEKVECVFISNYTQWRHSSLVVLDLLENIPTELKSERGW